MRVITGLKPEQSSRLCRGCEYEPLRDVPLVLEVTNTAPKTVVVFKFHLVHIQSTMAGPAADLLQLSGVVV